jgi:hypothetical protein
MVFQNHAFSGATRPRTRWEEDLCMSLQCLGAPPLRSSRRGRAAAARAAALCASAGRWGTPADACCAARRVRPPFGPLAWRPPPQSPQHARPDPPAGPGALPTPGVLPLRSSGRGRAAAARDGTLCATALRTDDADRPTENLISSAGKDQEHDVRR